MAVEREGGERVRSGELKTEAHFGKGWLGPPPVRLADDIHSFTCYGPRHIPLAAGVTDTHTHHTRPQTPSQPGLARTHALATFTRPGNQANVATHRWTV